MDKAISDKLVISLNETQIDLIDPDKDEIERVLKVKSSQISNLSEDMLTRYIYSLSQYLVFLQVQSNVRNIKYMDFKGVFELALHIEMSKVDAKTVKEKENTAILSSDKLQKMQLELRELAADARLFEKIPDRVEELINAFKKELSNKQARSQYRGKNG